MDKATYEALRKINETGSPIDTKEVNKLLKKALSIEVDIANPVSAAAVKDNIVGFGPIESTITPSSAYVEFDGFSTTRLDFASAFLDTLIKVIQAKALDQFFSEPAADKTKKREGLGSPAGGGRTVPGGRY